MEANLIVKLSNSSQLRCVAIATFWGEHCIQYVTKTDTDSGEDNAYSLQKGASKKI